ncbi:MAG: hypothetical protein HYZ57_15235 [Acidobacteria bacterium]|nr:hypothetical protein [Acidobacteriota bacterium]MBI3281187.1 hypothetical protein [Acidobacteriota bacterium]
MPTEYVLLIQILAAVLAVISAILGWLARSWSMRDEMAAREEVVKAKEQQVEALAVQLHDMREIRPLQIQQHLLAASRQMMDEAVRLADRVGERQRVKSELGDKIEEQRSRINLGLVRIAELEERKRTLQDFTEGLKDFVTKSQPPGRSYFEPGENALRATEAEQANVLAQIAGEQAAIAAARETIATLESQRAALEPEIGSLQRDLAAVEERCSQLHMAAEWIGAPGAPARRRLLTSEAADLEKIDVPEVRSYHA